jgi:hypothetical protein
MLAHLHPRGLGVQHEDLARRDIGKILDLVTNSHSRPPTPGMKTMCSVTR